MAEDKFTAGERRALDDIMRALKDAKPKGFKTQPVYVANAIDIRPMLCMIQVSQYRHALAAVDVKAVGEDYCPQHQQLLTKPLTRKECHQLINYIGQMAAIVAAQRGREQAQLTLPQA